MAEETMDRREAMEKAFNDLSSGSDGGGRASEGSSGGTSSPSTSDSKVASSGGASGGKDKDAPVVTRPAGQDGSKGAGKPPVAGTGDAKAGEVQPVPKKYKAPGGWKPHLRDRFGTLDPEIQEEIDRRERDMDRAHNLSSQHRQMANEFQKMVGPFEGLIRASGVTPMQAVGNLVQTAATLQTGTASQKVNVIAGLIRAYGIDLPLLDALLSGSGVPAHSQQTDQLARLVDQRLAPMQRFMQDMQNGRQQSERALAADVNKEIQTYATGDGAEFFEDLRNDAADILELAARRGRDMTLKEAFELAAKQHPEVSKVYEQRQNAARLSKEAESLQRSRRAAGGSTGGGTPGSGVGSARGAAAGQGRRADIEAAWSRLEGG